MTKNFIKMLKVENETIAVWGVLVMIALLIMSLSSFGVIDPAFLNFELVSGVFLIVGGLTIYLEEFYHKKKFDYKQPEKTTFVVIGGIAVIVGFLVMVKAITIGVDAIWLIGILYILLAVGVGSSLIK